MTTTAPAASNGRSGELSRRLVAVMAGATGLSVANNYFAQPLLPVIQTDLHMSGAVAGLIVTIAQLGYAAGLLLLLPLGDLLERRRLTSGLSLALAAGLAVFAIAPDTPVLLLAALGVGAMSVLAQILVPFAAGLAGEAERGRVVGAVMSGLLLGILLARTIAGWVAELGGWRVVYAVAAVAAAGQAFTLWRMLPDSRETTGLHYPRLLATVFTLLRDEPVLRRRALLGALGFASFSVLWTSMAFLLAGAPYHYSSGVIGLFGLVGAAGALAASGAGRLADRGLDRWTTVVGAGLLAVCWIPTAFAASSLALLIVGIAVLDLAVQAVHITNQSIVFGLSAQARSRINSAYMTSYFIGGAAGSALSAALWDAEGWRGVCVAGAGFGVCQLITAVYTVRRADHGLAETAAEVRGGP
jgi:predicted MFS family arabinose efflux permease